MADTNLLVLAREYKKLREEVKKVLSMPKGDKGDQGEKGEKGDTGDTGPQGFPGRDGKDGINGYDGKEGRDGVDGKDGKDGLDGVGVSNAYIDFDNSLVIVLTDGREVNAGFLSQETKDNVVATFKQGAQTLNELLPIQTGNANKFLKTDGENVSWDTLDGSDIDLASPPVIGNTTPNAATFTTLTATGETSLGGAAGSESLRVLSVASAVNYLTARGATSGSSVTLGAAGLNGGIATIVQSKGSAGVELWTNGGNQRQFVASHTASAVNYVQVTGASTGNSVRLTSAGSDATVGMILSSKALGNISFWSGDVSARQFQITPVASSVNYLQASGAASAFEPVLSAQGSDTNISMAFQSKGTGGISLSTGSTGTNLVNGTSVTAITRTGTGFSYTSFPSVAISAPTTAGGVQATAVVGSMVNTGSAVVSGGTGYTVNDVLTVVGGTSTGGPATLRVTSVSGGVVTAATPANFGQYTALPTNPVSVTGGTGSGATFDLTWGVGSNPSFTITNAGSGYVEQPTVTFSGGGGSGAAAFARVGSDTAVRSLGANMSFYTPAGEQVRIVDSGNTSTSFMNLRGGVGGCAIFPTGASSEMSIGSSGGFNLRFFTSATTNEQLRVSNTASAVNYVQVTGAATGGRPTISAQGSDTNAGLWVQAKGTGNIRFDTRTGASIAFLIADSGSAVNANWMQVTGSAAGAAPAFSVAGSDTNIDLALTPKGTGNVRFGTYTANMALTVQGYIEIKDSGGTVRRLAVVA